MNELILLRIVKNKIFPRKTKKPKMNKRRTHVTNFDLTVIFKPLLVYILSSYFTDFASTTTK